MRQRGFVVAPKNAKASREPKRPSLSPPPRQNRIDMKWLYQEPQTHNAQQHAARGTQPTAHSTQHAAHSTQHTTPDNNGKCERAGDWVLRLLFQRSLLGARG